VVSRPRMVPRLPDLPLADARGQCGRRGQGALEAQARSGISYTCHSDESGDHAPVLQPAGPHASKVKGQPATPQSHAVSPVICRYVTLPGILECDLRDHARACSTREPSTVLAAHGGQHEPTT